MQADLQQEGIPQINLQHNSEPTKHERYPLRKPQHQYTITSYLQANTAVAQLDQKAVTPSSPVAGAGVAGVAGVAGSAGVAGAGGSAGVAGVAEPEEVS